MAMTMNIDDPDGDGFQTPVMAAYGPVYRPPIYERQSEVMVMSWWSRLIALAAAFVQLGVIAIPEKWLSFLGNYAVIETGAMAISLALTTILIPLMKRIRAARRNHGLPCSPIKDKEGTLRT